MDKTGFHKHIVPLYRELFAIAVGIVQDRSDAADIVQDTMVKLWDNRDRLDSMASPRAFAITTLKNTAIDHLRRRGYNTDIDDPAIVAALTQPPDDTDPADLINEILSYLPPRQRKVIELSAYECRSVEQISDLTGLSNANVRQLLCRGRHKLKELYKKLTT